jgi:hypothetical protein
MKTPRQKNTQMRIPRTVTIQATIVRPMAFRRPISSRTMAMAKRINVAQGTSRVTGKRTKKKM